MANGAKEHEKRKRQLSIWIDADLHRDVKVRAVEEGVTLGELVARGLRMLLRAGKDAP